MKFARQLALSQGGFSLIEIITVLAIMGMVAGGAAVFGTSMMSTARLTETVAMSDALMREAHMMAKYQKLCTKVSYSDGGGAAGATLTLKSLPSQLNCCTQAGGWQKTNSIELRNVNIEGLDKDICFNDEAVLDERSDRILVFSTSADDVSKVVKVFWLTGKVMSK